MLGYRYNNEANTAHEELIKLYKRGIIKLVKFS